MINESCSCQLSIKSFLYWNDLIEGIPDIIQVLHPPPRRLKTWFISDCEEALGGSDWITLLPAFSKTLLASTFEKMKKMEKKRSHKKRTHKKHDESGIPLEKRTSDYPPCSWHRIPRMTMEYSNGYFLQMEILTSTAADSRLKGFTKKNLQEFTSSILFYKKNSNKITHPFTGSLRTNQRWSKFCLKVQLRCSWISSPERSSGKIWCRKMWYEPYGIWSEDYKPDFQQNWANSSISYLLSS